MIGNTGPLKEKRISAISLILLLVLSGCAGQGIVEDTEKEQWINTATPIAENILQSINNDDYQSFIADFSEQMKNSMPRQSFTELREKLLSVIGAYISSTPAQVERQGEYIVVYFNAKFEKEENVTVRVVFREDDPTHRVEGLWFDSPKLRG